ncbi:hypothetical protein [Streptomyces sp. XY006]|uniref:hypothetical protein n=1 Tax=Streptomyces sp. XY006 TaxID=2021410 RepID=UPI000B8BB62B|nr:hypothetical protein [Streptomyces sp. XY006]OXS35395.1 hypothetical protein CHR28_10330 [Streptomyces sp. XY006]
MNATARTARIAHLRESIARRALASAGITSARITNVRRVGTIFIVATEEPTNRWAPYAVETFRIPEPDDTDRDYEPGEAPKIWCPLAGWVGDGPDEVPDMLAKAIAYARTA